jgi:hypothetical protein
LSKPDISKPAILFSEMTPPPEREAEFNAWYDEEHIPLRVRIAGFASAQRYRDGETRNYLAVYEMTSGDALTTPDYVKLKTEPSPRTRDMLASVSGFTRYLANPLQPEAQPADIAAFIDAPVLYAVLFDVPPPRLEAFDGWYDGEHVPMLLEDPRWRGVRRFDIFDGAPAPFNRLALHYLSSRDVLDSDARKRARETPQRARLAQEPWFKGRYAIFDRLGPRFGAGA